MAELILLSIYILINVFSYAPSAASISSCYGPCQTWDDCDGQLICIGGQCKDDPDIGTNICGGSSPRPSGPSPSAGCQQSGSLTCSGQTYPTYSCSPPLTGSTPADLTLNDFSEGGDGGGPSECDGNFHDNGEKVVALSTGWFAGRSRCFSMIRITASNGRSTEAMVVDECDSMRGCDDEHAGQPPCRNNIVDASAAVWNDLELNMDDGVVPVTWSAA